MVDRHGTRGKGFKMLNVKAKMETMAEVICLMLTGVIVKQCGHMLSTVLFNYYIHYGRQACLQ